MSGSIMSIIVGASIGAACAIAGFLIAGLPGMIVGVLLAIPCSAIAGIYIGSHT